MKDCYEKKSFTEHFNRTNPHLLLSDEASRLAKAQKIFAVIREYVNNPEALKESRCLDLGCSEGRMTHFMADRVRRSFGIDTDRPALKTALEREPKTGAGFVCGSGLDLPFKDRSVDIIICNQIYEHVPDPYRMLDEIKRILKTGGFCFFGAGNRLKIIEGHYFLPFLSWLPKPLADMYLRMAGKGQSYEELHFTYFGIRKMVRKFRVHDYTIDVIKNPDRFAFDDASRGVRLASKLPRWFLRIFLPLSPNYLFILTHPDSGLPPERVTGTK